MKITNCSPTQLLLPRGTPLGMMETLLPDAATEVNETDYLEFVSQQAPSRPAPLSPERKIEIMKDLNLSVPEEEREAYLKLIFDNHDVFSKNPSDLGRANNFKHRIDIKNNAPVYIPQYRLADTHKVQLEAQIDEWLKMGIIQPSKSRYNSPIFVVPKKNGDNRYVLDYRALNANSHDDRYTMRTVDECIGEIGKARSTIFSTMDLSSGYHQMLLEPASRKYTAFTVPGKGQYEWLTTSMGLRGAVSSFQRMVEASMKGLNQVIIYLDDLLPHSRTHEQHRHILQQVFDRLRITGLKANLKNCHFGSKEVAYLGFQLTPQGILPGRDKLGAVRGATPPKDVHQVRQFLGLVNFFRNHVRNFSMIASPLTQLTRKDVAWRGGVLPPEALQAFNELKQILCSEPIVAYPRQDRPYSLIVDAAAGVTKVNSKGERTFRQEGGLGAILCQPDDRGELHVIAYASRALSEHEKNYSPFLLEMMACCWGIDHFETHLRGRKFVVYSDHRPLEKLSVVHTKTLNRLQQKMNEFDFVIQYKKGSEMPADFLSRNVLAEIDIFTADLPDLQKNDEFADAVIKFLQLRQLPEDKSKAAYVAKVAAECFLEDNILWRRMTRHDMPARTVVVVPKTLVDELVQETHASLLGGHEGITKTKERLLQSYFWPNMDHDITKHTSTCQRCQSRRKDVHPIKNLLSPLPQCSSLNQRVHFDLFGPLKTSTEGKKYVLCITDAFTKYAEMIAVDNKEAPTVAKASFERWVCRFGTPLEFVSDNGREFYNKFTKELFTLLQIKHTTTTPYWPQCNSQAEVANKTIQKYLASFVDETTLDWPLYMAPMAFAYNTSLHRTIKATPFFLTFGVEPRYPSFPNPEVQRYYGESQAAEWYNRLLHCRQIAAQQQAAATNQAAQDYNKTAAPHNFVAGQCVWLNEMNFLGRNRKLSPNWTGPYTITQVLPSGVVELQLPNRKLRVNVGRIKPYMQPVQMQLRSTWMPKMIEPNLRPAQPMPSAPPPPQPQPAPQLPKRRAKEYIYVPMQTAQYVTLPPQQPLPPPPTPPPQPEPMARRGRGRPPKLRTPIVVPHIIPQGAPMPDPQVIVNVPPPPPPQPPPADRMITRAMARAQERAALQPAQANALLAAVNGSAQQYLSQTFKPRMHQSVAEGPAFIADEYGLPKLFPGDKQPKSILRRRRFLKNLSPEKRNLLLTGDPFFAFDPVAYELCLTVPRRQLPQPIAQEFDYLLQPEAQIPAPLFPVPPPGAENPPAWPAPLNFDKTEPPRIGPGMSSSSSSSSNTPMVTPPQSPSDVVATPRRPGRPPKGPDVAGATAMAESWSTYDRPGNYFLRSSPTHKSPAQPSANVPLSGWHRSLQRAKEVFDDYTQVPPPGWKPPKAERDALRAARGPSTMSQVARAARQAAKIISTPPFQPPTPPQQRRDTGARPKHPK